MKRLLLGLLATLVLLVAAPTPVQANGFDAILGARLLNGAPEPYFVVRYNYLVKFISVPNAYYVWVRPEFRLDDNPEESYLGGEIVLDIPGTVGFAVDYKYDGESELTVELRTRF